MDTTLLWIHFHVLGHAYWNSQKIFRVMYKDNFQEWRPHVWQSIKRDYGFGSDVNEDDLFESEDPAIPSTSNSVTNAQNKPSTCTTLSTLEKKVDQVIRMLSKEEEKSSVKEVFKCSIRLETCSNLMTSCRRDFWVASYAFTKLTHAHSVAAILPLQRIGNLALYQGWKASLEFLRFHLLLLCLN